MSYLPNDSDSDSGLDYKHNQEQDLEQKQDQAQTAPYVPLCRGGECKQAYSDNDIESVVWAPYKLQTGEFEDCPPPTSNVWQIMLVTGQEVVIRSQHNLYSDLKKGLSNISGNLWCPMCDYMFASVHYTFRTERVPELVENLKKKMEEDRLFREKHGYERGMRGRGR